jgi:methyl-accepting chemotaxis protein
MHDMSIRMRLFAMVGLALLLIATLAGLNVYLSRASESSLAAVYERNVQPLTLMRQMDGALKETRFRLAGVLLDQMPVQGSRNQLKEVRAELPLLWRHFNERVAAAELPAAEQEAIGKIADNLGKADAFLARLDAAYAKDDRKLLASLLEDEWPVIHTSLLKPLAVLIPAREAAVKATYEANVVTGNRLSFLSMAVALAGLALFLAFALWITGSIRRGMAAIGEALEAMSAGDLTARVAARGDDELGAMADKLNRMAVRVSETVSAVQSAAGEVAGVSVSLASSTAQMLERGEQRNARILEVSAAMEEMRASIGGISEGVGEVVKAAEETQLAAGAGQANIGKSAVASRETLQAVESSSIAVTELSESVKRISHVAGTIREIAEQTNLLALNAAIEAARAGEQGRGFAVVADEVRKLAERTGASTSDIAHMVEAINATAIAAVDKMQATMRQVEENSSLAEQTRGSLNAIDGAAARVTELANHIALAMREQSATTTTTAHNMEQIAELTQSNAAHLRSMNDSAGTLRDSAGDMQTRISQFKLA